MKNFEEAALLKAALFKTVSGEKMEGLIYVLPIRWLLFKIIDR